MKYNHAFTFAFELKSNDPEGDVGASALRQAIIEHLAKISDEDLVTNCSAPSDTFEIEIEKEKEKS